MTQEVHPDFKKSLPSKAKSELDNHNIISSESDDELILKSQDGDVEAFSKLVEKYSKQIYNLCYYLTGDEDEANDVFQETFIRAYKSIKQFQRKAKFLTWLYRIAVNVWRSEMRKPDRRKIVLFDEENGIENTRIETQEKELSPQQELEKEELQKIVQQEIAKLSSDLQLVIILRYVEGKSYEEIAKICRCSLGTVGSRIYRAVEQLRKNLLPLLDEIYGRKIKEPSK
jgi:RNA polymerase sigma-70 factor (ECF subfamily)